MMPLLSVDTQSDGLDSNINYVWIAIIKSWTTMMPTLGSWPYK